MRKHVAAEYPRDVQPSIQLLSVSCSAANSKLGVTMVRPRLQSVPDAPALDQLSVSKQKASFVRFLHPVTVTFDLFI